MADSKDTALYLEEFDDIKTSPREDIGKPESLAGLSEDELQKFGVRTTIRLDFVIMPAMTIMYIL